MGFHKKEEKGLDMHTDWVPVVSAPLIGIYSLTMTLEQMTHLRDGELHFQSHLVDYGN